MASDTELFGEELTSPIIEEECHNDAEESSLDEPNSAKNISVEMETGKLKKKLGFVALFAYIFGGIIGSGIFISPVKVIQTVSTGGLVLGLWLAGGTIAVLGGVSYVELGSFVRNSGGEFVYIEKGFSFRGRKPFNVIGSLLSFSTIWTNVLILRPASISIIMLTFAEYLVRPFYPFYCEVPSVVMSLLAVAAIIALGLINSFTQKGASVLMIVFTAMKLLSMIFIILLGVERLASGDTQTLSDTFHAPLKSTATVGTIFGSLYGILWAYEAWNNTAYYVEEVKNIKTVPYSSTLATVMVTVVYLLVNLAYLCVLNLEEIDSLTGEAIAVPFAQKVIGKAGLIIIPILVSVSTFGSANGSIFVASRMIFAASRSSCLPSMLGGLHVKFGTPIPAIILTVILSSLYASIGSISGLIDSFSAAIWVYYALTFTSLLIMRVTYRKEERPFKVFFVIPLVMVFVSLAVVIFPLKDQLWESIGSFGGILLSVPVYFLFIYIGPFPKCLSFYVTFKSKLAKLNAYTADAVNRLLNCAPPAVQPDGLDDVQPKDSSSTT